MSDPGVDDAFSKRALGYLKTIYEEDFALLERYRKISFEERLSLDIK